MFENVCGRAIYAIAKNWKNKKATHQIIFVAMPCASLDAFVCHWMADCHSYDTEWPFFIPSAAAIFPFDVYLSNQCLWTGAQSFQQVRTNRIQAGGIHPLEVYRYKRLQALAASPPPVLPSMRRESPIHPVALLRSKNNCKHSLRHCEPTSQSMAQENPSKRNPSMGLRWFWWFRLDLPPKQHESLKQDIEVTIWILVVLLRASSKLYQRRPQICKKLIHVLCNYTGTKGYLFAYFEAGSKKGYPYAF